MQTLIEPLLARCRPGWSLPGEFYSDEEVYRHDVARVWRTGWLFAGHGCEIPKAGDFFTLEVEKYWINVPAALSLFVINP